MVASVALRIAMHRWLDAGHHAGLLDPNATGCIFSFLAFWMWVHSATLPNTTGWQPVSFCGCDVRHHVWPLPTPSFWQAAGLLYGVKYNDAVLDVHVFGQAAHCPSVHPVLGVLGVMKQHALPSAPTVLSLGMMCMLVSMHTSGAFAVWFVLLSACEVAGLPCTS